MEERGAGIWCLGHPGYGGEGDNKGAREEGQ